MDGGRAHAVTFPPLTELVAHRPPMLLLDRVVAADGDSVTCEVDLHAGSMFARDGAVSAVVFVEYMAQAVAACAGLRARARGEAVTPGLLLGSREVAFMVREARAGDRLEVRAALVWSDPAMGSYVCEVRRDGEVLACGTLNVYQGEISSIDP